MVAFIASANITVGSGIGGSLSIDWVLFNKGINKGDIYMYNTWSKGFAVGEGVGLSFGTVDYNEDCKISFDKDIFVGKSRESAFSIGAISATNITSYIDNKSHFFNPFTKQLTVYNALLVGLGDGSDYSIGVFESITLDNALKVGTFDTTMK